MKNKIRKLAEEKNAIILAHNYQPPEVQDLADFCGDSLELSMRAADTDADVILFCGVLFMAETASILSPEKIVLLPNMDAGCPMADTVTAGALIFQKERYPSMPIVSYVNSCAAVKAISTICCTSANVLEVVKSLDAEEILMVPDRNLARFAASKTRKTVHEWNGCCPIHDSLTAEEALRAKEAHPEAVFMVHPECRTEVVALADAVLSTSGMIRYAASSDRKEFIVGTEAGLLYSLKKAIPEKIFYSVSPAMQCPDMKKTTLQDIFRSLETMADQVKVPESIQQPALKSLEQMFEVSRKKT
jgi:quinolinate synthase